jgi:hypothetical protein
MLGLDAGALGRWGGSAKGFPCSDWGMLVGTAGNYVRMVALASVVVIVAAVAWRSAGASGSAAPGALAPPRLVSERRMSNGVVVKMWQVPGGRLMVAGGAGSSVLQTTTSTGTGDTIAISGGGLQKSGDPVARYSASGRSVEREALAIGLSVKQAQQMARNLGVK